MFNDVIEDKICEKDNELSSKFSEYYIFKDYNTYAIDNKNKCMCLGYILAFSNKWNVFPKNNDNNDYYVSRDNIDNMINIIEAYEKEEINSI
jgi:hypothetical protein